MILFIFIKVIMLWFEFNFSTSAVLICLLSYFLLLYLSWTIYKLVKVRLRSEYQDTEDSIEAGHLRYLANPPEIHYNVCLRIPSFCPVVCWFVGLFVWLVGCLVLLMIC